MLFLGPKCNQVNSSWGLRSQRSPDILAGFRGELPGKGEKNRKGKKKEENGSAG